MCVRGGGACDQQLHSIFRNTRKPPLISARWRRCARACPSVQLCAAPYPAQLVAGAAVSTPPARTAPPRPAPRRTCQVVCRDIADAAGRARDQGDLAAELRHGCLPLHAAPRAAPLLPPGFGVAACGDGRAPVGASTGGIHAAASHDRAVAGRPRGLQLAIAGLKQRRPICSLPALQLQLECFVSILGRVCRRHGGRRAPSSRSQSQLAPRALRRRAHLSGLAMLAKERPDSKQRNGMELGAVGGLVQQRSSGAGAGAAPAAAAAAALEARAPALRPAPPAPGCRGRAEALRLALRGSSGGEGRRRRRTVDRRRLDHLQLSEPQNQAPPRPPPLPLPNSIHLYLHSRPQDSAWWPKSLKNSSTGSSTAIRGASSFQIYMVNSIIAETMSPPLACWVFEVGGECVGRFLGHFGHSGQSYGQKKPQAR